MRVPRPAVIATPRIGPRHAAASTALAIAALLPATARADEGQLAVPAPVRSAAAELEPRHALARVRFLASDELRGRDTASPGLEVAARYLASELEAAGLEPAGDDGTFFHRVDLRQVALGDGAGVALADGSARVALDGQAADLLPGSGQGEVEGEVVFVGYGIRSEDPAYDDYAGVDLTGKVALMLRFEPGEQDPESPFDGAEASRHAYIQTKMQLARQAGAAAVLLVTGPRYHAGKDAFLGSAGPRIAGLADDRGGPQGGRRRRQGGAALPAVHLSQRAAASMFASAGLDLAVEQAAIDKDLAPRSRALGVRVRVSVAQGEKRIPSYNVAAMLRGGDPERAHEIVVIGAHYDHVGVSGDGEDQIHNGADDNASGTAAVLEAARALARMDERPRRSVMILFFTAEELGLLGSRAFIQRPTVPLDHIVGMINLDMVGRNAPEKLTVLGTGEAPELWKLVEAANRDPASGFTLTSAARSGGGSDHQSFIDAGIPSVHFFSGFHPEYHEPGDHTDKIDGGKVARSGRLAMMTAWLAADTDVLPSRARASVPPPAPPPAPAPGTPAPAPGKRAEMF